MREKNNPNSAERLYKFFIYLVLIMLAVSIIIPVEDSCLASHLYAGQSPFDKKGCIRYNKRNKDRIGKRRLTDELMARYQPGADAAGGFFGGNRN